MNVGTCDQRGNSLAQDFGIIIRLFLGQIICQTRFVSWVVMLLFGLYRLPGCDNNWKRTPVKSQLRHHQVVVPGSASSHGSLSPLTHCDDDDYGEDADDDANADDGEL